MGILLTILALVSVIRCKYLYFPEVPFDDDHVPLPMARFETRRWLDAMKLPAAFTIELWLRPAPEWRRGSPLVRFVGASESSVVLIERTTSSSSDDSTRFALYLRDANVSLHDVAVSPSRAFRADVATKSIAADKWSHIAATFDSARGEMRLLLNGDLEQTTGKVNAGALLAVAPLFVALGGSINGATYAGACNELRIWSVARSVQDIRRDYALSFKPTLSDLTAGLL